MNIAYSCNDYYVPQTGISIISLCENNKDVDEIIIYFIGKDVSKDNIDTLRSLTERYNRKFKYVDFASIAYDLNISAIGRHIETIYAKVFFTRIKGVDKIIYLDSDTLITGSLVPLWDEDLSDSYMGAVQTFSKIKSQLDISESEPFFNDGVAIVNVDYCRKNHLTEKVLKVIDEYSGSPPTLSEGALNKVCQGHVKYISIKWNCMAGILYFARLNVKELAKELDQYSLSDIKNACDNPVIIHYLTAFYNRPWFTPCTHPYKEPYFKYKRISPWKDVEPTYHPLPLKIKCIDLCYKLLGYRLTNLVRSFLNK